MFQEMLEKFIDGFSSTKNLIATVIGLTAMAISFSSYLFKEQKKIAFIQIISVILFVIQYIILGQPAGAIIDSVVLFMVIVFFCKNYYSWAKKNFWIYAFMGLFILSYPATLFIFMKGQTLTASNYVFELLPVIGSILYGIGFNSTDGKIVRIFNLLKTPWWFVYNFYAMSLAGLITEVIVAITVVIGMFRYDYKKPETTTDKNN